VNKPKTTFPRNILELLTFGRNVKASLANNPFFANPSPDFTAAYTLVCETIDKLQAAQDESLAGGSQKKQYRDAMAEELVSALKKLAKYVDLVADGDAKILKSSGFEIVETGSKKSRVPAQLPTLQVNMTHGPEQGTFLAKAKAVSYVLSYEAHIAQGDPTTPDNWGHYGFFPQCSHMLITNRTAGQNYSMRFRVITAKGEGPWSAVHTLMSL
jgi:hypothetical protein